MGIVTTLYLMYFLVSITLIYARDPLREQFLLLLFGHL
jgi:hypothetical protein